jgi:N-methylhydantoinase B
VRVETPSAQLSVLSEKNLLPPYGVCGGAAGAPNRFVVLRDGREVVPSGVPGKVSGFPLRAGDVVLMESSGGGGHGDPLDRDPADVARDVAEGLVGADPAESVYGVVLAEGRVDPEATRRRRAAIRAARPTLRLRADAGSPEPEGHRVCRLSAAAAARLGVEAGDVLELVNPRGAPLRAWVVTEEGGGSDEARLAPEALAMLGAADGARVEARVILHRTAQRR